MRSSCWISGLAHLPAPWATIRRCPPCLLTCRGAGACLSARPPAGSGRALSALTLLLLCLLAGAGCAARNRPATEPTAVLTATVPLAPRYVYAHLHPHPHPHCPAHPHCPIARPRTAHFQDRGRPRPDGAAEPGGGGGHRRGAGPPRRQARCHAAVLPPAHPARALVGMYQ